MKNTKKTSSNHPSVSHGQNFNDFDKQYHQIFLYHQNCQITNSLITYCLQNCIFTYEQKAFGNSLKIEKTKMNFSINVKQIPRQD